MSDLIHLLPDSVANQIAAGEVIQRPASVVKELIENSIDAGATLIHILLTDSGKTCIQVIDDGKGMTETDARMAFERHATSKIAQAADLFSLATFGFRGEALPSIAAVAQVELHTRTINDELGTVVNIEGSKVVGQSVEMCAVGCNFIVKNLFFNVPARRKFLKSEQTELSNIIIEVERASLIHPEIAFTLHNNDSELLNLVPTNQRQRIMQLFGKKINQDLLNIEVQTSIVNITGFVGTPESARKKGNHQFFFVNGRFMRHPYFHRAVMESFTQLIPENEQVSYFISFEIDPARIDVNIHPTKTEIKFEDEHVIWQIIVASIREVLGRTHSTPSIDFDTADRPDIPVLTGIRDIAEPKLDLDPGYNPFTSSHIQPSYRRQPIEWEKLYGTTSGPITTTKRALLPPDEDNTSIHMAQQSEKQVLFQNCDFTHERTFDCTQYNGQYIITSIGSGLMLIEQHRAHTRILFDRYMKQFQGGKSASQGMLFPEILQVSPAEAVHMDLLLSDFACLGFDISNLGGGSFSIQGVPFDIEGLDPCRLVQDMLTSAIEKGSNVRSDMHFGMALTMARSAAIITGQVLTMEEMNTLVGNLFACSMPNYTPDGKKIICIIDDSDITKMFA
jgi:DNA mismatch repair protein MutL